MSTSNKILLLLACLVTACSPAYKATTFGEADLHTASLYHSLLTDARQALPGMNIQGFNRIVAYRSRFRGKRVAHNSVLEHAVLNDSSYFNSDTVNFLLPAAYGQDAYIIHLQTAPEQEDVFLYLALKYDTYIKHMKETGDDILAYRCLGISACYFGTLYNKDKNIIRWRDVVKVKRNATGNFYLKDVGDTDLAFTLANKFIPGTEQLSVKDIIFGQKNKIGGMRPMIFNVAGTFKDMDHLYFNSSFVIQ